MKQDSIQPDIEILQPINLELLVTRNLAASWFTKIPGVQVQGVLQSLNVCLTWLLLLLFKLRLKCFAE